VRDWAGDLSALDEEAISDPTNNCDEYVENHVHDPGERSQPTWWP
jgi:hypothetical protein